MLFELYYANMHSIVPNMRSYEEKRSDWLLAVSPALEKEPRKILLCMDGQDIAGYVQYYIRDRLIMIEEVQLARRYHKTTVFFGMCRFLARNLPDGLLDLEAYAHRQNTYSQMLMKKLGMKILSEDSGEFVHLRGDARVIRTRFS